MAGRKRHRWHTTMDGTEQFCGDCKLRRRRARGAPSIWMYLMRCGNWTYEDSTPKCPPAARCQHGCIFTVAGKCIPRKRGNEDGGSVVSGA